MSETLKQILMTVIFGFFLSTIIGRLISELLIRQIWGA